MRTIKSATNNQWNNANPRGVDTLSTYKQTVPAAVFARFERAEAAHRNLLEMAPLFVGAVVVGNMGGLSNCTYMCVTSSTPFSPIVA